jgi:hypothetical protein
MREVGALERRGGGARIDPCLPERFGGVDVPDSSDQTLIEKGRLDRAASSGQPRCEVGRLDRLRGVRPKPQGERRSGVADVERGQCPWVDKPDTRAIVELDHGTGESRLGVTAAVNVPITGHPKMRMQRPAVREVKQLVLPSPLDLTDACAEERFQSRSRHLRAKTRVEDASPRNRASLRRGAEHSNGGFDLRKLRHQGIRGNVSTSDNRDDQQWATCPGAR